MFRSTRNRSFLHPVRGAVLACLFACSAWAGQSLPVFLSDNHAETFGWITRTFDVDARYEMVLVDAHSDASAVERSEEIREGIRRVPDKKSRDAAVEKWREEGRIQAFNWIEPLLPRPVDEITWLGGTGLTPARRGEMTAEATGMLDGRSEVEPRSAGSFTGRWQTVDIAGFLKWNPGSKPVILAIDLDFFAGMDASTRNTTFGKIWQTAMDWPGLAGVSFSVSRPWLKDDPEAEALVSLACDAVAQTRGALLEIDASWDDRPDESLKARELENKVPRWNAETVSTPLRARLLNLVGRVSFIDRKRDWNEILENWRNTNPGATIHPDRGEIDCDGVWRFPSDQAPVLRINAPSEATGNVRWFFLEPSRTSYDLLPKTRLGKDFSTSPARWIHRDRREIAVTTDFALDPRQWHSGKPGRVEIGAEFETADGWITVPEIDIRLSRGGGFRASLSECFGMPYVFGIAGVRENESSGVETGWGSDCSNALIHAWRRNGLPLAWGDPGRLRAALSARAENVSPRDEVSFTPAELEAGIAIDFGRHVAALWEDREPVGKLGGNDLVFHHLGGFPELVELASLAAERPGFAVRMPASTRPTCKIRAAGDVVLAGENRVTIEGFAKENADLFIANLEGAPSHLSPAHPPRYDFRFPPGRLPWLKERGIGVVSLANNHAGDAGPRGLVEALENLRAAGIPAVGAGRDAAEACTPHVTVRNGVTLSLFGVCLVESIVATADSPGVASLPHHADLLENEIRRAKTDGHGIVVMTHGGEEYTATVNQLQRHWSRWLADRGVSLIVGSHPHVVQRIEKHAGATIVHSLGNAVYPESLKGADSGVVLDFAVQSISR